MHVSIEDELCDNYQKDLEEFLAKEKDLYSTPSKYPPEAYNAASQAHEINSARLKTTKDAVQKLQAKMQNSTQLLLNHNWGKYD